MSLRSSLQALLRISRPKQWLKLFGPYFLGVLVALPTLTAAQTPFAWVRVLAFGLYFLFPAHLLFYGISDLSDHEQDRLKGRTIGIDTVAKEVGIRRLMNLIILFTIPFLLLGFFTSWWALGTFFLFLFLAVFYSADPIRAKNIPFLDSFFSIFSILPGIFGYYLAGGDNVRWPIYFGAIIWAVAAHAYSRVPSIEADEKAHRTTIATFLGQRITLTVCLALFLGSSLLVSELMGFVTRVLGIVYASIMVISLQQKTNHDLLQIYRWFPVINLLTGMSLLILILTKLTRV